MFDAAAEITKAVRNKKWIKGKKLTALTYLPKVYVISDLRRKICHLLKHIGEIYLGKNDSHHDNNTRGTTSWGKNGHGHVLYQTFRTASSSSFFIIFVITTPKVLGSTA